MKAPPIPEVWFEHEGITVWHAGYYPPNGNLVGPREDHREQIFWAIERKVYALDIGPIIMSAVPPSVVLGVQHQIEVLLGKRKQLSILEPCARET